MTDPDHAAPITASEGCEPAPDAVRPDALALERGIYTLTPSLKVSAGAAARGARAASGPDGSPALLFRYGRGAEVTRALYPHPLLPPLLDAREDEDGTVIAHPLVSPERLLAQAVSERDVPAIAPALVDLARLNRYLNARGYRLTGLDEDGVSLNPTRLLWLPTLEPLTGPRPARDGEFILGELLYRTLTGQPVSTPLMLPDVPGAPQVLGALVTAPVARAEAAEALELLLSFASANLPRLHLQVAAASSIGLNAERIVNEDACGFRPRVELSQFGQDEGMVACVADGMGGMDRGEVAAQCAVRAFLDADGPITVEGARARTLTVNAKVLESLGSASGGCTFTGLLIEGSRAILAHVGDTRAYLTTGGVTRQLTQDHSLVAMLVSAGMLDASEARGHPDANKVTRALGSARALEADAVQALAVELQPRDRLTLVTDGVWNPVTTEELERLLAAPGSAREVADALVRAALNAGAPDNATALVVNVVEWPAL